MGTCERFNFEGLEALRVGRYGGKVNSTCILYRMGETVVDTGPPNQWRRVRRFLREREVSQVLITHHHEDHGGNLARIQSKWKSRILVHESGLSLHREGFPVPFYRRLVWGKPKHSYGAEAFPQSVEMTGDFQLRPIHTPGHAQDMTCFLEPNRGWLFSGDLFIASRPRYLRKVEDPNEEIESLRRLLSYDFGTLFCSHRGIIRDGRRALKDKLSYLVALREQVRHYLGAGYSIMEITRRFLGKEDFLHYFSLGEFSKRHFVEAFAAHARRSQHEKEGDESES